MNPKVGSVTSTSVAGLPSRRFRTFDALRIGKSMLPGFWTPDVNSDVEEPIVPSVDGPGRLSGTLMLFRLPSWLMSSPEPSPNPSSWSMKFQACRLATPVPLLWASTRSPKFSFTSPSADAAWTRSIRW